MSNEKFWMKPLPKLETEINLINAMVGVLIYEENTQSPNQLVIKSAHEILSNKVLEIAKLMKNPSRYETKELIDLDTE